MTESKKYVPFVSPASTLPEFTLRALIIGLVMSVVLGAANAYLGLKAGMTIAATYPAAVIGMAILRIMKGSILEENFARTVGSIGESVAAGAIFTLPAFYIARIWHPDNNTSFFTTENFLISVAIMFAGGLLGIMFVALLRKVMVEDVELPFPESVAAGEIHKAGQRGGSGAKFLFATMGVGGLIKALGELKLFASSWASFVEFFKTTIKGTAIEAKGGVVLSSPAVKPAYLGVGYIIGPKLASLNFSGGLLAWGLLTPIIYYFIGPTIDLATWAAQLSASAQITLEEATKRVQDPIFQMTEVWKFIVRPIAIGGMLVGAGYTLYRMRKSLITGISRSISDVKKAAIGTEKSVERTERDLRFNYIILGIAVASIGTFFIYNYFAQDIYAALVATFVMIVAGFFFAAVSGYLVGIIGSSNNPISGLTLSTLIVAALLMVALGMKGIQGVAAVLGVAAVVCVAAAVAGEMLQDLKVGHILGGTPWKMQAGNVIGALVSAAVMFIPIVILHQGDINAGKLADPPYEGGFGGPVLPAPQASLMAMLSTGIVGGEMAWPLIIVGMLMGFGFILMQVRSPMLVSVGMYLPLGTTFAIFIGGLIKGIVERVNEKKKFNDAQKARVENVGILLAAGLIAGEALIGLLFAGFAFAEVKLLAIFAKPSFLVSLLVFVIVAWILIQVPVKNAGSPDEPAPPSAMM